MAAWQEGDKKRTFLSFFSFFFFKYKRGKNGKCNFLSILNFCSEKAWHYIFEYCEKSAPELGCNHCRVFSVLNAQWQKVGIYSFMPPGNSKPRVFVGIYSCMKVSFQRQCLLASISLFYLALSTLPN